MRGFGACHWLIIDVSPVLTANACAATCSTGSDTEDGPDEPPVSISRLGRLDAAHDYMMRSPRPGNETPSAASVAAQHRKNIRLVGPMAQLGAIEQRVSEILQSLVRRCRRAEPPHSAPTYLRDWLTHVDAGVVRRCCWPVTRV